jgi:iron complex outermembrane recepter protein
MGKYQSLLLFLSLCLGGWATPVWAEKLEVKSQKSEVGVQGLHPLSHKSQVTSQNLAQSSQITRVTGVEVKQTPAGVQVILKTPPGQAKLVPLILTEGNNLVIDLLDATLAFSIRNGVTQTNPAPGISEVRVTKIDATSIRVTIKGGSQAPSAEVVPSRQDLVLSVTPKATAKAKPEEEIEIVVTGEREEDNYAVPNSNVGTRTDTPIKDVPQSIQVIPRQVIEDQGATELNDLLLNVPGVSQSGDAGGFQIRGFGASENILSDGTTAPATSQNFNRDPNFNLSNVEQVEVLKGPASVLYGTGQPGGTINITTEQPLKDPRYEIEATIGNFDFYRGDLDLTGPLNNSQSILYRLNITYENADSFIDFVNYDQFNIFPVLNFELGQNTKLTLEGGYQTRSGNDFNFGQRPVGTVFPNPLGELPRSRNLGDPRSNVDFTSFYLGYLLEHNFNEDWSLRNRFRASFSDFESVFVSPGDLEADNRTLARNAADQRDESQDYRLETEVNGTVKTGIVRQELLLGLELQRNIFDEVFTFRDAPPIDIFDPDYGDFPDSGTFETSIDAFTRNDTIGLYAQNLLSISEQVKILLGGRYDWVFQNSEDRLENTSTDEDATAFAPRVGIVYQPIEPVSLYASWSRSFEPQFGVDREGNPFVPIRGEQFEVGVKTEFLDGRLAATLAAYQITRQNDFIADPVDPDNFSIQLGEQRSRGFEFDLTGEPLPGLRLIATYAYTDGTITEADEAIPGLEGSRILNVPEHSGSLWAVYEIQGGTLEGLGFGAGVFVVGGGRQGASPGDVEVNYELPGYTRTNALLYYRRDNWKAQLNIDNLFDERYFESSIFNSVYLGAPFTVRGQLSVEF